MIPEHIQSEFKAVLAFLAAQGAAGLAGKLVVIPMEDAAMNEEIRYGVCVDTGGNVYAPLFFLDIQGWVPAQPDDEDIPIHRAEKTLSAEEILAQIPDDAIASFEDTEFLCTADDFDEDVIDD